TFFFFQAEDGIRGRNVTGVQTCALPILPFCLSQGMTVVPYLYLGHIMKKRRWLEQPRLPWLFPAAAVCMAVSAVGSILSGATDKIGRASCREGEDSAGRCGARGGQNERA